MDYSVKINFCLCYYINFLLYLKVIDVSNVSGIFTWLFFPLDNRSFYNGHKNETTRKDSPIFFLLTSLYNTYYTNN